MADRLNPYAELQVSATAGPEVVQAAYRALARANHPDLSDDPEASVRMVRLNTAREILISPELRAAYDQEARFEAQSTPAARAASNQAATPDWRVGPDCRPGRTLGSVLTFGRYAGWSLGEIARVDLNYLEWLTRTQAGIGYRDEICKIIEGARPPARSVPATKQKRRFGILR